MLLVVGTQAAVIGTAVLGTGLDIQRTVARLQPILLGFPITDIVGDQSLLRPMLATSLEQIDISVFGDDLGRNQTKAGLAQASCLTQKQIRSALARAGDLARDDRRTIHRQPAPRTTRGRC